MAESSKPLLRIYADTSVFGGCFDPGLEEDSRRVFALVRAGRALLLVSQVVADELRDAPLRVRRMLEELPASQTQSIALTHSVLDLRDAYLAAGVVGIDSQDDATHVAAASAARADSIVSWNFRHIVRRDKIRRYNEVNIRLGHPTLTIVSPRELRLDDEERE